jgi:FkbM family methyltransferase
MIRFNSRNKTQGKAPIDLLKDANVWNKDETQRVNMTISCRDTDYIPKVNGAGKIKTIEDQKIQVMHNGLKVVAGGYYGDWMTSIISSLEGHHEPQEEKIFYEVLKRIHGNPTILELGSHWSYYSLWFLKQFRTARAIACEPDENNIRVGVENAKINGLENRILFKKVAAGSIDQKRIKLSKDTDPSKKYSAVIQTVDSIIKEHKIKKLDILHMDVQGAEYDTLLGAIRSIRNKTIRFVFVSTHHYAFSGDPLTHQKCKNFLIENGATIVAAHNVLESYSGDGLIVASFQEEDKQFRVEVSRNSSDDSLFRPYEEDLAQLINAYS